MFNKMANKKSHSKFQGVGAKEKLESSKLRKITKKYF